MKIRLASLLLLAAALSAPVFASEKNDTAVPVRVSNVGGYIERGAPRVAVFAHLGSPSRRLSSDVWAYDGFRADVASVNERGCDTLIITFVDNQVADLKLVNRPAARSIAADLKLAKARTVAAAQ